MLTTSSYLAYNYQTTTHNSDLILSTLHLFYPLSLLDLRYQHISFCISYLLETTPPILLLVLSITLTLPEIILIL